MKKSYLFLIFLLNFVTLSAQPIIGTQALDPELNITRFGLYNLDVPVTKNGTIINSVQAKFTPLLGGQDLPTNYYVNGTAYIEDDLIRDLLKSTTIGDIETWEYSYLKPDEIYPEVFFMPSTVTNDNPPSDKIISKDNYDLMHYVNPFTITASQTSFFIEFYATPKASAPFSGDIQVYLVEKNKDITFFNNSGWMSDPSAELVGTINKDESFNHEHTENSKHYLVSLSANADGTIGNNNLDVTGDFWIVLYTNLKTNRGWSLKYHPGEDNFNRWYSGSGNSFAVSTLGAPDVHVHIIQNSASSVGDGVKTLTTVTYNSAPTVSQEASFYFGTIPDVAPNASSFILPAAGTYSGDVDISWEPATDANNDPLTYTVNILEAGTDNIVETPISATSSATYTYNTTTRTNGEYDIQVVVSDGSLTNSFKWSSNNLDAFIIANDATSTIWNGSVSTGWNTATNWSAGVPTSTTAVSIPSGTTYNPLITESARVTGNVTIASGTILTIGDGGSLMVSGVLVNEAGESGLIINSGGSLVQGSTVSGTIIREITSDNDWHFLSVPIDQATMPEILDGNFAPTSANFAVWIATYDFYQWSPTINMWVNLKMENGSVNTSDFGDPPRFENGKGYLVAYNNTFAGSSTKSVSGTLASGTVLVDLSNANGGYNLVGNPFPSSLDWKASSGWSRVDLAEYTTDDVAYNVWIWNDATGNFGAYNSTLEADIGTNGMSRYIPPMQAFYVKAATNGILEMSNDVRVNSSQTWLKSNSQLSNTFRLKITNDQNSYSDEIQIEFGHENDMGGAEKLESMYSEAPSLSTNKNGEQYSIDFRSNHNLQTPIPLSFNCGVDGIYTLSAQLNPNIETIILEDLLLDTKIDFINNPSYSFSANSNADPNRFILHFSPVGIDYNLTKLPINIFAAKDKVEIRSDEPTDAQINIYNISGQLLISSQLVNENRTTINIANYKGIAVVSVVTESSVINKKVILW